MDGEEKGEEGGRGEEVREVEEGRKEEEDVRDQEKGREEEEEGGRVSRTLAPSNIHRVVNLWLYLVNDELRLDELRGAGYDLYIKDAGR